MEIFLALGVFSTEDCLKDRSLSDPMRRKFMLILCTARILRMRFFKRLYQKKKTKSFQKIIQLQFSWRLLICPKHLYHLFYLDPCPPSPSSYKRRDGEGVWHSRYWVPFQSLCHHALWGWPWSGELWPCEILNRTNMKKVINDSSVNCPARLQQHEERDGVKGHLKN